MHSEKTSVFKTALYTTQTIIGDSIMAYTIVLIPNTLVYDNGILIYWCYILWGFYLCHHCNPLCCYAVTLVSVFLPMFDIVIIHMCITRIEHLEAAKSPAIKCRGQSSHLHIGKCPCPVNVHITETAGCRNSDTSSAASSHAAVKEEDIV